MFSGRSAGALLIVLLAVLTGCGGTGDPLASRTATEVEPSSTRSGSDLDPTAGGSTSASSAGGSTGSAGSIAPTASTVPSPDGTVGPTAARGSDSASTDPTSPGRVAADRSGNPTTIEVTASTAGVLASPPSSPIGASTTSRSSAGTRTTATTSGSVTAKRTTATTRRPATTTRRATSTATARRTTTTTHRRTTTTGRTTTTPDQEEVLLFTRTAGYRHPSIGDGVSALSGLARSAGYRVTASEDPGLFNDRDLSAFAVVVFLSTSGDVLNTGQQAAFERYIEGGGGFVGVHAATDTEYGWSWYGRLVGTWFADHPLLPNDEFVDCHCFTASVIRQASHPSTDHLPAVWSHRDEWYNFRSPLPASAQILLTVDESTYPGGTMGAVHPVTWTKTIGQGRSWYTALGHTPASYQDADFRRHLLGGLEWAAG